MKSSKPSTDSSPAPTADKHPLAVEGGVVSVASAPRDPYAALDDLMVVVEALCPQWPARPLFKGRTIL